MLIISEPFGERAEYDGLIVSSLVFFFLLLQQGCRYILVNYLKAYRNGGRTKASRHYVVQEVYQIQVSMTKRI